VLAVTFLLRARTKDALDRRALLIACVVAALGPLAWMAWNGATHGDPLHFFVRVSTFRQNSGSAPRSVMERVLEYPLALLGHYFIAMGAVILGVAVRRPRHTLVVPLMGTAAIMAFLVIGDLSDGAPTHHPERALGAIATVFVALGVSRLGEARKPTLGLIGLAAAMVLTWFAHASETPGKGDS
jgi:peptidoglycan/LPS O-acetylase OafA/YrhL